MTRRSVRVLIFVCLACVVRLNAATPTFWEVSSLAEFVEGDLHGLAIDADGRLTLGPSIRLTADTTAPMVWRLVAADNGSLLAGTGNDGKVYRITPDGQASVAFDSSELQVHALALGPDGSFYAGTSPDGKVYRITRDGSVSELFDPEDTYIWALAAAKDGAVYVATGEKGVIYRVSPDGTAAPFYKTRATNVTALAFDSGGNLLAGTSSPAQVLRIDAEARGFVLLDTPYSEIRALRLDPRGAVYAVAIRGGTEQPARPVERPATETTSAPIPTVSTEITITAIGDVATGAGPTTQSSPRTEARPRSSQGAVYRIAPDGLWEQVWESTEDVLFDVAVEREGSLLVATGNKGRILRLAGDPVRLTIVGRADAQQVTSLAQSTKGVIYYATANPGKVFEIAQPFVAEGSYESEIRDATNVASWGLIQWKAATPDGTRVQLSTRSGNTKTPDETWSPWSTPYESSEGEAITSPKAQYLQFKATLSGKQSSPVLTSVTVAYLPRNTRPSVASITVHPPGIVFARPFPTGDPEIAGYETGTADARPQTPAPAPVAGGAPALGRRMYAKGLQTFVWKADDEPNDKLRYDIFYRRQGTSEWQVLRRDVWDPILTWDTSSVPDGTYTIRVVASDSPSNAPGVALAADRESEPFDVDNTAPAVTVTSVTTDQGRTTVAFVVKDSQSPLERVEYSLDANRWRPAYPVDGIADSKEERYQVVLEPGVQLPLMIRAVDGLNNVGSAQATAADR